MTSRASDEPSRRFPSWARWLGTGAAVVVGGITLGAVCRGETNGPPAVSALTRGGHPVRWTRSEIVLEPVLGASEALSTIGLAQALEQGAREWNGALDDCAAPTLRVSPGTASLGRIRQDGRSVVLVRADSWCPEGAREPEECYDAKRAAITHLYPVQSPSSPRDGAVEEADIEINAVDYRWSLDGDEPGTRSLRTVVVHELGHVLGLDHSCSAKTKARADNGAQSLACTAPEAKRSVMYPDLGEPGLEAVTEPGRNEVRALCALYPRARTR